MKDYDDDNIEIAGMSSSMGTEVISRSKTLHKIELHIHPPLSYKLTSKRVGALVLERHIKKIETISEFFIKLYNENPDVWKDLIDIEKKKMRPPIRTILNGKALSPTVFDQTYLSDGDKISLVVQLAGG